MVGWLDGLSKWVGWVVIDSEQRVFFLSNDTIQHGLISGIYRVSYEDS